MDEGPSKTSSRLEFRREALSAPAAVEMIRALNAELVRRYPEEDTKHFRLDADEVAEGRGVFLVAYRDAEPLACGALRRIDPETGELKRMYVRPDARGQGIGRRLLAGLEDEARRLGLKRVVLETGQRQPEALALYEGAGFVKIPPFGEYTTSPLSVCMAKGISQSVRPPLRHRPV